MTDKTLKQPGVRVDGSLWEEFRNEVKNRRGGVRGHLRNELETALREYIDGSKQEIEPSQLHRIEQRLDSIEHSLGAEQPKKKKESDGPSTTEKRLRKIRSTIGDEVGDAPTVHENIVEMAIRDNAGSSGPTIRRYKQLLTQDKCLFQHPAKDSVYFRDSADYATLVQGMAERGGLTNDEYWNIVEQYGEEWWSSQLEGDEDDGSKGFQ